MVDGHKCICINPWASYGGGSLPLWAVEGHDAQLTVRKPNAPDGYIRGTCIKINEETQMIEFKASVPYGNTTKFEILQLCLEELGDTTRIGDNENPIAKHHETPELASQKKALS